MTYPFKIPSDESTRRQAYRQCKASRTGTYYPSVESERFIAKMHKQYPEWMSYLQGLIFDDTVPFGSSVKYQRTKLASDLTTIIGERRLGICGVCKKEYPMAIMSTLSDKSQCCYKCMEVQP